MEEKQIEVADGKKMNFTGCGVQLIKEKVNCTLDTASGGHRQPLIGQMATTSFPNGYGHGPRTHDESIALNCIDKPSVKQNYRIRKLTPKECGRLMGVKDEDIDKMSVHLSNSKLYHCFGDAICVPVLSAIFEQML